MMQGDSYCLGIELLNNAGSHITPENVADVEITVGRVSKSLRRGQIRFENNAWLYPLSQRESMAMMPGSVPAQVRVVWKNGAVEGCELYGIRARESLSKEVL